MGAWKNARSGVVTLARMHDDPDLDDEFDESEEDDA
jgi:hypothetical protein